MDLIDRVREIANQIPMLKQGLIKTEEGTKNALVMPFIKALGYDVFNPLEVTPELVADVGTKKGEKVDYAILRDGKPIILFECKSVDTKLVDVHLSQLYRYFSVTEARFAILTNGVVYQFYTDLEAPNKMDDKPFLVFDMTDIKEPLVEELKKFTKSAFDVDKIMSTASELKYTNAIKALIVNEMAQPSDELVRFFAAQVYPGQIRQNIIAQFAEITKRAWREVMTDRLKQTLTKAAEDTEEAPPDEKPIDIAPDTKVQTTDEELEAYRIVRAILRQDVDVKKIAIRDAQSYCSILFDDNNRKPICRLYFNTSKKYIGIINADKSEERIQIESLDEIYSLADKLKECVKTYL